MSCKCGKYAASMKYDSLQVALENVLIETDRSLVMGGGDQFVTFAISVRGPVTGVATCHTVEKWASAVFEFKWHFVVFSFFLHQKIFHDVRHDNFSLCYSENGQKLLHGESSPMRNANRCRSIICVEFGQQEGFQYSGGFIRFIKQIV
jgi:hypothetical protein